MKVAKVMEKKPITIAPQMTLRQVARLIFGNRISSVPVIDGKGRLLGIVVEKDILRQIYPSQREYIENFSSSPDFEKLEERATEAMNLRVEQFMSYGPLTISSQMPLLKAGSLMMAKRVRSLPVVDRNNHLIGVVSLSNVFRAIVRERLPISRKRTGFFNNLAKFFDLTFSWEQREKYEIPFLIRHFKKRGVKRVLDIGCGTGGHTIALAQNGFKVIGIDVVREMQEEARKKMAGLPKKVQENIKLINLPLKKLDTIKEEKCDAVIFMGNAFANFLKIEEEIEILNQALKPEATIVVHLRNFEKLLKKKQRFLSFNYNPGLDDREREYAFLRFYDHHDDDTITLNIETLVNDGKKWRSYGVESTPQRPFTKKDLREILGKIGFKQIRFFTRFGGESYTAGNEFIITLATR